jgi:hypothetical protein
MKTDIFEFFCENWIFFKKIWILKSYENLNFLKYRIFNVFFHCEETRPLVSIFAYIDAMLLNLEAPVPLVFHQNEWSQIKVNCLWSPVIN